MERLLVIDQGQSRCRLEYFENGRSVGFTDANAPRVLQHGQQWRDRMQDGLVQALERLGLKGDRPSVDVVSYGTNLGRMSQDAAADFRNMLASVVHFGTAIITDDAVTAFAGALGYTPGVVVTVGTGIVGLACAEPGNYTYIGGWGYMLGDQGSGYAIGHRALVEAVRAYEGRGGSIDLMRRTESKFGPMSELAAKIYGVENPIREIAAFVPEVAEAARSGDTIAVEIWRQAVKDIYELIDTVSDGMNSALPIRISWCGDIFRNRDLLLDPLIQQIRQKSPKIVPVCPSGNSMDGARFIGQSGRPDFFGSAVHIFSS